MEENECIEQVQVSELRKRYKSYLAAKKPLILRKNRTVVGLLLCVECHRWGGIDHPRKERSRLRAEFEAVLKQISGR